MSGSLLGTGDILVNKMGNKSSAYILVGEYKTQIMYVISKVYSMLEDVKCYDKKVE